MMPAMRVVREATGAAEARLLHASYFADPDIAGCQRPSKRVQFLLHSVISTVAGECGRLTYAAGEPLDGAGNLISGSVGDMPQIRDS